jgi:hypothetical protein
MYDRPPNVVFVSITTAGAPNTNAVHAVLSAPGVGFRLRIVAVNWSAVWNVAAGTAIHGRFQDTTAVNFWTISSLGTKTHTLIMPEPGTVLVANRGLQINSLATVASQVVDVSVWYYIDVVA